MKKSEKDGLGQESFLLPADGGQHYELGYEIGLDFERLRLLRKHNVKENGRKGAKKC